MLASPCSSYIEKERLKTKYSHGVPIVREKSRVGTPSVTGDMYLICSYAELEVALVVSEAINTPPSFPPASDRRRDDDSEDEDSDDDRKPSSRMRSAGTSTNGRTGKNIRQGGTKKKGDDDDSDFDFDL